MHDLDPRGIFERGGQVHARDVIGHVDGTTQQQQDAIRGRGHRLVDDLLQLGRTLPVILIGHVDHLVAGLVFVQDVGAAASDVVPEPFLGEGVVFGHLRLDHLGVYDGGVGS